MIYNTPAWFLIVVMGASIASCTMATTASTDARRLASRIGYLENEIVALTYRIAQNNAETQARLKLIRADAEKARDAE